MLFDDQSLGLWFGTVVEIVSRWTSGSILKGAVSFAEVSKAESRGVQLGSSARCWMWMLGAVRGFALLHFRSIHANLNEADSRFVDLMMCNPKLPCSRKCGITRWDGNEVYGQDDLSGEAEGGCGMGTGQGRKLTR